MKFRAYILFSILSLMSYAQDKVYFMFDFYNDLTLEKVSDVNLNISDQFENEINLSNYKGHTIAFEWKKSHLALNLVVQKPGYTDKDTLIYITKEQIINKINAKESFSFRIGLNNKTQNFGTVEITGKLRPKVEYGSPILQVQDFDISKDGELFILAYEKNINKDATLLRKKQDVTKRISIENSAISIEKDHKGVLYLSYENYLLQFDSIENQFLNYVKSDDFIEKIKPIQYEYKNWMMYSTLNELYPAMEYVLLDQKDTSYITLLEIEDKEMMEHYRAEFKFAPARTKLWAWEKEDVTGIDREVWVGAAIFTNSLYYEPVYSSCFAIQDTLFMCDYYENKLYKYCIETGEYLDSLSIDFHLNRIKTGWQKEIHFDEVSKRVFVQYNKAGFTNIYELDLATGKLLGSFQLSFRYVDKVRIYNNRVYYIYRPYESPQKRYIYSEKIKTN